MRAEIDLNTINQNSKVIMNTITHYKAKATGLGKELDTASVANTRISEYL